MLLLNSALAVLSATSLIAADAILANQPFTAHEWGTFTSVAGEDGKAVEWAPLNGPADLPCFVARGGSPNPKLSPGLVRMETPVLHFYARARITASVHVDFPKGLITEWYPQTGESNASASPTLDWKSVEISPGEAAEF